MPPLKETLSILDLDLLNTMVSRLMAGHRMTLILRMMTRTWAVSKERGGAGPLPYLSARNVCAGRDPVETLPLEKTFDL